MGFGRSDSIRSNDDGGSDASARSLPRAPSPRAPRRPHRVKGGVLAAPPSLIVDSSGFMVNPLRAVAAPKKMSAAVAATYMQSLLKRAQVPSVAAAGGAGVGLPSGSAVDVRARILGFQKFPVRESATLNVRLYSLASDGLVRLARRNLQQYISSNLSALRLSDGASLLSLTEREIFNKSTLFVFVPDLREANFFGTLKQIESLSCLAMSYLQDAYLYDASFDVRSLFSVVENIRALIAENRLIFQSFGSGPSLLQEIESAFALDPSNRNFREAKAILLFILQDLQVFDVVKTPGLVVPDPIKAYVAKRALGLRVNQDWRWSLEPLARAGSSDIALRPFVKIFEFACSRLEFDARPDVSVAISSTVARVVNKVVVCDVDGVIKVKSVDFLDEISSTSADALGFAILPLVLVQDARGQLHIVNAAVDSVVDAFTRNEHLFTADGLPESLPVVITEDGILVLADPPAGADASVGVATRSAFSKSYGVMFKIGEDGRLFVKEKNAMLPRVAEPFASTRTYLDDLHIPVLRLADDVVEWRGAEVAPVARVALGDFRRIHIYPVLANVEVGVPNGVAQIRLDLLLVKKYVDKILAARERRFGLDLALWDSHANTLEQNFALLYLSLRCLVHNFAHYATDSNAFEKDKKYFDSRFLRELSILFSSLPLIIGHATTKSFDYGRFSDGNISSFKAHIGLLLRMLPLVVNFVKQASTPASAMGRRRGSGFKPVSAVDLSVLHKTALFLYFMKGVEDTRVFEAFGMHLSYQNVVSSSVLDRLRDSSLRELSDVLNPYHIGFIEGYAVHPPSLLAPKRSVSQSSALKHKAWSRYKDKVRAGEISFVGFLLLLFVAAISVCAYGNSFDTARALGIRRGFASLGIGACGCVDAVAGNATVGGAGACYPAVLVGPSPVLSALPSPIAPPSPTVMYSPTGSSGPSPSGVASVSRYPSAMATATVTLTRGVSASVTAMQTLSPTGTPSMTITISVTTSASGTLSGSGTSTETSSGSGTLTGTSSSAGTASVTFTVSPFATDTSSNTMTISISPTVTATVTVTPSLNGSFTAMVTLTSSNSESASDTATQTFTATASGSSTWTPSVSMSCVAGTAFSGVAVARNVGVIAGSTQRIITVVGATTTVVGTGCTGGPAGGVGDGTYICPGSSVVNIGGSSLGNPVAAEVMDYLANGCIVRSTVNLNSGVVPSVTATQTNSPSVAASARRLLRVMMEEDDRTADVWRQQRAAASSHAALRPKEIRPTHPMVSRS